MKESFQARYLRTPSFEYEGKKVQISVEYSISDLSVIWVTFIKSIQDPPQGLIVSGDGCLVKALGVTAHQVVCWEDRSPKQFKIEFDSCGDDSKVFIWNAWRVGERSVSALEDGGLVVEEQEHARVILHCNWGKNYRRSFDSLVVELRLQHCGAQSIVTL